MENTEGVCANLGWYYYGCLLYTGWYSRKSERGGMRDLLGIWSRYGRDFTKMITNHQLFRLKCVVANLAVTCRTFGQNNEKNCTDLVF